MHNNSLFKSLLFTAGILLFVSCDKEYSAVGDALIGDNNFELVKYPSNVEAHNEKITSTDPIESNNLDVNALGIYDNPAFGKTTANFVTQLTLATLNPTFGTNPVIESVYLEVPYFSTLLTTDATSGDHTYELDSIYGESKAKIKLSVYESGRYMGTQNGTAQTFYTNQNAEFDAQKKLFGTDGRLNNDADKSQNDEFFFDSSEIKITTKDADNKDVITRKVPSMRLKLNSNFFDDRIIHAPSGSLVNNDVFINYFKGLYFKVEQSGADKGSLAMINFRKGTITIKYKEDSSTTPVTRVEKSLVLNMLGATASLLEKSNPNTDYETATSNPNRVLGDQKLYLKGGEGSLAVLELFEKKDLIGYDENGNLTGPNEVSDELDKIRKEGWLINDANLVFHIDAKTMKDSYEPGRIYLYDYANNTTVLDYYLGASTTNKNTSKYLFGGYLTKDATTKRGVTYKINVTNHIRNLVKNADAKNVKLGVVVTEDMNVADFKLLQTGNAFISQAPKASVMNPLGTILYGSNLPDTDENYSKRLQLEIYYTKPK